MPIPTTLDCNVNTVIDYLNSYIVDHDKYLTLSHKFAERVSHGIKKYGITTNRDDLTKSQWLMHAIEEHMDACVYLARLRKFKLSTIEIHRIDGALHDTLKNLALLWDLWEHA